MNQKLSPLFESDGLGADRKYTFNYIIETLKYIRKQSISVCDVKSSILSEPIQEQKHILNLLEVAIQRSHTRELKKTPDILIFLFFLSARKLHPAGGACRR